MALKEQSQEESRRRLSPARPGAVSKNTIILGTAAMERDNEPGWPGTIGARRCWPQVVDFFSIVRAAVLVLFLRQTHPGLVPIFSELTSRRRRSESFLSLIKKKRYENSGRTLRSKTSCTSRGSRLGCGRGGCQLSLHAPFRSSPRNLVPHTHHLSQQLD